MTTQATAISDDNENGAVLHMAMELSHKTWVLMFSNGVKRRRVSVDARDLDALRSAITDAKVRLKLPTDAAVVSCFEAGRDGFWLHRALLAIGVSNQVVDSASIEVNRKKRRAKSDRIDVAKLMNQLERWFRGEGQALTIVRVPPEDDEDFRRLPRLIKRLKKEAGALTARIRSSLITQGITLDAVGGKTWPDKVAALRKWDGEPLPAGLSIELIADGGRLALVRRQLRELEAERRRLEHSAREAAAAGRAVRDERMQKIVRLQSLRSIGPETAWTLVPEFFGWRQFDNRRQVGSAAGLTGVPYQSGSMDRDQGIDKAGNSRVRAVMNEIAWLWLRYQPGSALTHWYNERFANGSKRQRRVGIVALMRKLLIALWRFVECGVLPEGATLKPGAVA